jgi:N-acyl-D-amino-acid deacylase
MDSRPASSRLVIRGGDVLDGTGAPAVRADVLVIGDRIAEVGEIGPVDAEVLDARGMTVCPGFINPLSQAYFSLQRDPRGLSDLVQGVTTEVFGEGYSVGPFTDAAAALMAEQMPHDARWAWPTLAEGLKAFDRTTALNTASFVGHDNVRLCAAGAEDRHLTAAELDRACALLGDELDDGALGLGAALMYAPSQFAPPEEFIALARILAERDALYIVHIRNESDALLESLDEVIDVCRATGVRAQIHHLKASGTRNWDTMPAAIERIERARESGLALDANMYPYTVGATSLAASIPQQYHSGGAGRLLRRLRDPGGRREIADAIRAGGGPHQNLFADCGGPDGVLLTQPTPLLTGRRLPVTLRDAAAALDRDAVDLLLDLVTAEPGMPALYRLGTPANLRRVLDRPWVSVGSDAATGDPGDPGVDGDAHPRGYGTFARILGHYVRDEATLTLPQAVRRMTSLPADTLRLAHRGRLTPGHYADIAVFDPTTIADHATYDQPRRLATGMRHVIVNGQICLKSGQATAARPGRALRRG